jgi:hypothetical protein
LNSPEQPFFLLTVLFNDSLDLSGGEVNGPCVQLRSRRCYTYALLAIGMSAQTKQFSHSILGPTFVAFWVFHIAIRKDAGAVLRLMNSTGRLEVDRRLCFDHSHNTVLQSLVGNFPVPSVSIFAQTVLILIC